VIYRAILYIQTDQSDMNELSTGIGKDLFVDDFSIVSITLLSSTAASFLTNCMNDAG
jgi:hypothetical protein